MLVSDIFTSGLSRTVTPMTTTAMTATIGITTVITAAGGTTETAAGTMSGLVGLDN